MRLLPAGIVLVTLSASVAWQAPAVPAEGAATGTARQVFEVASIKRNVSGDQNSQIQAQPGGRVIVTNNTLYNLIRNAYGIQRYELVIARSDGRLGPQMKPAVVDCSPAARAAGTQPALPPGGFCGTRSGNGNVSMRGVLLSNFVRNVGGMTGRFVIDKTGLTGPFDLDLQWTPDQGGGAPAQERGAQVDGTSLVAAVQEQLGLRLVAQRAPVEVLVIESAERPTED